MRYCNHCTCMLMHQAPPLQPAISPIGNVHCMHSARTLALNTVRRRAALPEHAPIRRATLHRWLSPRCHVQARLRRREAEDISICVSNAHAGAHAVL